MWTLLVVVGCADEWTKIDMVGTIDQARSIRWSWRSLLSDGSRNNLFSISGSFTVTVVDIDFIGWYSVVIDTDANIGRIWSNLVLSCLYWLHLSNTLGAIVIWIFLLAWLFLSLISSSCSDDAWIGSSVPKLKIHCCIRACDGNCSPIGDNFGMLYTLGNPYIIIKKCDRTYMISWWYVHLICNCWFLEYWDNQYIGGNFWHYLIM